jgi:hypothetical protein
MSSGTCPLQHRGTVAIEFVLEQENHVGMIATYVVHAISGIEIEDMRAIGGEKVGAEAIRVVDVHAQDIERSHPLRFDRLFVGRLRCGCGVCFGHNSVTFTNWKNYAA